MKKTIHFLSFFLLCTLLSQSIFAQIDVNTPLSGGPSEKGDFYRRAPYTLPFKQHILSANVANTKRAFFGLDDSICMLIYNPQLPAEYDLIRFRTDSLGAALFGVEPTDGKFDVSQNPSQTEIVSVQTFPQSITVSDASINKKYIRGAFLAKKGVNSFIHQFIYDTTTTHGNSLHMIGEAGASGGISGFTFNTSEYNTKNIQQIAITNVFRCDEYFTPAPASKSYSLRYKIRHNIWAIGEGILQYYDGFYWTNFSANAASVRTKSDTKMDFDDLMSKNNENVQVISINAGTLFTSIYALDSTNIWVGGFGGKMLKITHDVTGGKRVSGVTGSSPIPDITFTTITTGVTDTIKSIYFSSTSKGFFATDKGKIYETTNGGTNWTEKYSDPTASFNGMFIANSANGTIFAAGKTSGNIKTPLAVYRNSDNTWQPELSLDKAYSLEKIKPSFNGGHFFTASATDSLGFLVGDNGYILKIPDTTVLRLINTGTATPVQRITSDSFEMVTPLPFYPTGSGTLVTNMKMFAFKDTSPYLIVTAPATPGYRKPDCIDDITSVLSSTCADTALYTNLPNVLISNYPNYNNTTAGFRYNYSGALDPFISKFSIDPLPGPANTFQDVTLTYKPSNYNFSLDTSRLKIELYSSGFGRKVVSIKQDPFKLDWNKPIDSFINAGNYNQSGKYSSISKTTDSIRVQVLGAFRVQTIPADTYYDIQIDNKELNERIDTPILRKARLQKGVTLTDKAGSVPFDTISFTSKKHFIRSAPIHDVENYDSVIFTQTGPCKQDGTNCPTTQRGARLFKAPLLLGITHNFTNTAGATDNKNYKIAGADGLIIATAPTKADTTYNNYIPLVKDSVVFCVTGNLKNLSATGTTPPCYANVNDDANYFVATYGNPYLNYKVYVKPDNRLSAAEKTSRYQFQMQPNNTLVNGVASVTLTAGKTVNDVPWRLDTFYSSSCTNADSIVVTNLTCANNNIDLKFNIQMQPGKTNKKVFEIVDTLVMEFSGYDNVLKAGVRDTTIKQRIVKLIKLHQEKNKFHLMYQTRPGVTSPIPAGPANDSVDTRLATGIDNIITIGAVPSPDATLTKRDTIVLRSDLDWEYRTMSLSINPDSIGYKALPDWATPINTGYTDSSKFLFPYFEHFFHANKINFTNKKRSAKVRVCLKDETDANACKVITIIQDSFLLEMPNLVFKTDQINCPDLTVQCFNDNILWLGARLGKKMNVHGRGEKDSTQDIYIRSDYKWEIRAKDSITAVIFDPITGNPDAASIAKGFPSWIGLHSKFPAPIIDSGEYKQVSSTETFRRINFKTVGINNKTSTDYRYDTFLVCIKDSVGETPVGAPKICKKVFAEQEYFDLQIQFLNAEDLGLNGTTQLDQDTLHFRYLTSHIDSLKILTEDTFTIKYFPTVATIEPATSQAKKSVDLFFSTVSATDSVGNSIIYLKPKQNNLGETPILDSFQICLKSVVGVCRKILTTQEPNRLRVVYQQATDTALKIGYRKDAFDSVYIVHDTAIEFKKYDKATSTWIVDAALASNTNFGFKDSVQLSEDLPARNVFKNPSTHKVYLNAKNRNLAIDQLFDSVQVCKAGSTKQCAVIKILQDIPSIQLNRKNTDTIFYSHKANQTGTVQVTSNADWSWQNKDGSTWTTTNSLVDTSATNVPNRNDKTVEFFTINKNVTQIINRDSVRICVDGIGAAPNNTDAQKKKYCKTVAFVQDTAKLNIGKTTNGTDTLFFSYNSLKLDSIKISANDVIEIFDLAPNLSWLDTATNPSINHFVKSTVPPTSTSQRDFLENTSQLYFKSIETNNTKFMRYGKVTVRIKGTNIQKTFVVRQDTPFLKLVGRKVIHLNRRAGENFDGVIVASNTGWTLSSPTRLNRQYDIKDSIGDGTFVYNSTAGIIYDSSESAYLRIKALQNNDYPYRLKDEIYITTLGGGIKDTITVIQDSAYLNFELPKPENNSIYPTSSNPIDGVPSITVPGYANTQFQVKINGNIDWEATNWKWATSNSWNSLVQPKPGVALDPNTNTLIIKANLNNSIESVFPRIDTISLHAILNGRDTVLLRFVIKQDPLQVGIEDNYLIYPSPVQSQLIIKSKNYIPDRAEKGYVYIYDMNGNMIALRPFTNGMIDFDFSVLSTAYYILKVYDGNIYYQTMILKQ